MDKVFLLSKKIAFVHGRPEGHPVHAKYALEVGADFHYEDKFLRWQDKTGSTKLRRYFSWLVNAFFFPNKSTYDLIITESFRIPQLLMKKFKLLRSDQKLVSLLGDETLYFLKAKKYPFLTRKVLKAFLKSCDLIICTSQFQSQLVKEILNPKEDQVVTIFNGLNPAYFRKIKLPELRTKKVLFLGNISTDWRVWYKGLDIAIASIEQVIEKIPEITLDIVGRVDEKIQIKLFESISDKKLTDRINFLGSSDKLYDIIPNYDLVIHPARGEAWGITVHMSLACGVPTIVSELTGTKEIVQKIDSKLIVKTKNDDLANRIQWYFSLPEIERRYLSKKCSQIAREYTEEKSLALFVQAFDYLYSY